LIITINVPLILKVRDIIFFYVFCPKQKIISRTFKIRGTLVFLCPKERERECKSERESKRKNKSISKRERERREKREERREKREERREKRDER
jgi:hypothetical protein